MQDSKRDTDVKNRLLDSVGEGKGGMIWENSIETCILPCEIDGQSSFDAWDRVLGAGALGWPRGMGGREVGRGFRMGNTCTPAADSCQLFLIKKKSHKAYESVSWIVLKKI